MKCWSPTLPTEKQWSPGFTAPVSTWCKFMSASQSSNVQRGRLMPGISGGFPPSFPQGRRPLWGGDRGSDGRQEPERLGWGPQLIPSPAGEAWRGRAGERAERRAGPRTCHSPRRPR